MSCGSWMEKLDVYLDGESNEADTRALENHLRECAQCTAQVLSKVQLKRAMQSAGRRFMPDPAFRARIQENFARQPSRLKLIWLPILAAPYVLIAVFIVISALGHGSGDQPMLAELADLHIATLASTNPVDVPSSDRHTVKPWFEGKIPFTFNLPELQGTPFTLVGGKVSYLHQSPGAELVFRVRQHQISVFIFREQALGKVRLEDSTDARSFNVRSWNHNGLRYFVIADVSGKDLDELAALLKAAS